MARLIIGLNQSRRVLMQKAVIKRFQQPQKNNERRVIRLKNNDVYQIRAQLGPML